MECSAYVTDKTDKFRVSEKSPTPLANRMSENSKFQNRQSFSNQTVEQLLNKLLKP